MVEAAVEWVAAVVVASEEVREEASERVAALVVEPAVVGALVAVEVEGLEEVRVEALEPVVVWEAGLAEVVAAAWAVVVEAG